MTYLISTQTNSAYYTDIRAGFQQWTDVAMSTFVFTDGGMSTATSVAYDGINLINISPTFCSDNGTCGMGILGTSSCWTSSSPYGITEADILLNGEEFTWGDGSGGTQNTVGVVAHESGHDAGLTHPGSTCRASGSSGCGAEFSGATMYWMDGVGHQTLELDDVASLIYGYPRSTMRVQVMQSGSPVSGATVELIGTSTPVNGSDIASGGRVYGDVAAACRFGDKTDSATYVAATPFTLTDSSGFTNYINPVHQSFSVKVTKDTSMVTQAVTVADGTSTVVVTLSTEPQLAYSGTTFEESDLNDGAIKTTIEIQCVNDSFTGSNGENFVTAGKVVVSNVPPGLTAQIVRSTAQIVTATLTGNALSHQSADDVTNLRFAFQDSAFLGGDASLVANADKADLHVDFDDNPLGWFALGSGVSYSGTPLVEALAFDSTNDVLYAGGFFTSAGGNTACCVARWNPTTSTWSALGNTGLNSDVWALAVAADGDLYVGGAFTQTIDGAVTGLNHIARWDAQTSTWNTMGSGMNSGGYVRALLVAPNGALYAGGYFTTAGGVSANCIAAWNGSAWNALGAGVSGTGSNQVDALAYDSSSNTLYAGGYFTTAGSATAYMVAAWNVAASTWSTVGTNFGLNSVVYALAWNATGSTLYAGGGFTQTASGGTPAGRLASWGGGAWDQLGGGLNGTVDALSWKSCNSELYVGGEFTDAGSNASADYAAAWNGNTWLNLGTGTNNDVYALTWSDLDVMYAGGYFTTAGGNAANFIAQWNEVSCPTLIDLLSFVATPSTNGIDLAWKTATEIDNAGFHLWRAKEGAGEYVRITTALIPAEGNFGQGADYSFADQFVQPETTYHYQLEDIDLMGVSTFHGPVTTRTASAAITLLSPADQTPFPSSAPLFQWMVQGFDLCQLQFSASADFTTRSVLLPASRGIEGQEYRPLEAEWGAVAGLARPGASVYWRVIGRSGQNEPVPSAPFALVIGEFWTPQPRSLGDIVTASD